MIGTVKREGFFKFMAFALPPLWGIAAFSAEFQGSVELETRGSYSRLQLAIDSSFHPKFSDSPKGFR